MVKTLDRYLINLFFKKLFLVSIIFFTLAIILTVFEEITFFDDVNSRFYLPFLLAALNAPTTILEILPFVMLITTQLFFLELIQKRENELINLNNLDNFYFIKLLSICAFLFGIMVITIFYPFSSKLKFIYFEFKNIYSKDGKYLKHFSENGLWIKDEINNKIYIINGSEKKDNFLLNVFISEFDSDFNLINNFSSKKVDISSNTWILESPILFKDNKQVLLDENMTIQSHFDLDKINKSFRNLNSLNVIQLIKEKEENKTLGYSSEEIDLHILKIVSLPIYFSIMVVISSIIMLNIKRDRPFVFHILLGITLSVIIYYISNIFEIFGLTDKIPVYLSVFFPIIILIIISTLGLVRINEK